MLYYPPFTQPRHTGYIQYSLCSKQLFFYIAKLSKIPLKDTERVLESVMWAKNVRHTWLWPCRHCYRTLQGGPRVQCLCNKLKTTFSFLPKLTILTFSLDPDLTPLFHVTRAIGAKWTRSSSFPVIYFPFPVWQVTLFCTLSFPKGLETDLDTAHTVASLVQMGLIFL